MFTQAFKKFISIPSVDAEDEIAQHRVYQCLKDIQQAHTLIDLLDEESGLHYQSIVLNVDEVRRQLTIDELFPAGFQGGNNAPLRVSFHQPNGRRISFEGKIIAYEQRGSASYYVLAMPAVLVGEQRRAVYRLNVGHTADVDAMLSVIDAHDALGRLVDISVDGVRLELSTEHAEQFYVGQRDVAVRFDFDGVIISCGLDIFTVLPMTTGSSRVHIGGRFVDMPRDVQRELERSIMQVQRERLRI